MANVDPKYGHGAIISKSLQNILHVSTSKVVDGNEALECHGGSLLTPNGPFVPIGDKPVWAESLDFILFLDFLKLFVNMHLGISFAEVQISYFLDVRIKNYGEMKILGEVWIGWAIAKANQQELTTSAPKGRFEESL
jgi:hypothetical protein